MREKERSTQIIFVRHGQPDFPSDRIYCDSVEDPILNDAGRAQAAQTAQYLSAENISAIYVSPSQRAQETARAIVAYHELELVTESDLIERRFGIWEGLYFNEIESRYPEEHQAWKANQAAFKPEGGESVYDLMDRVGPVVNRIVGNHHGETVVVVGHVGPIRALITEALGMPIEHYRQLQIDPASMSRIDYGKSQNNLIFMNFHSRHWAD